MTTEGASFGEQLLDASRRNNTDLLEHIYTGLDHNADKIAELVNASRDPLGNTALHLCCKYGSWEVLDSLLDQEGGIEIDPRNVDGETPLHLTVRYCDEEPEHGLFIARNLIEVGADPRIKNEHNQLPLDLLHGEGKDDLIDLLQGAALAADSNDIGEEEKEVIDDDDDDEQEEPEEA